jgi:hypothetical protein
VVYNSNSSFGKLREKKFGALNFNVKVWSVESFLVSTFQSLAMAKLRTTKNKKLSALKSLATSLGVVKNFSFTSPNFDTFGVLRA